jgi:deoxyribose-phosphate aldolase
MENDDLIEKITREVLSRLKDTNQNAKGDRGSSGSPPKGSVLTPAELAGYIDHTLLKPDAVTKQFEQLCDEAVKFKFYSVCVNSGWVPFVAKKLRGTGIKICSVVGFPLGEMDTRSKAFEARSAISNGADEIDMVINVSALRSGDLKLVEEDIRAIRRATRSNTILKVIIETVFLKEEQKVVACELSKKADADFVKTSTGFSGGGATVEDILLMRRVVGPDFGVKASGGIRSWDQAIALIHAGANRLGCGASVAIVTKKATDSKY